MPNPRPSTSNSKSKLGKYRSGGLSAINTAMIISALPFSLVMALMGVSLVKAVVRDTMRQRETGSGR